jgi:hypothetical protein
MKKMLACIVMLLALSTLYGKTASSAEYTTQKGDSVKKLSALLGELPQILVELNPWLVIQCDNYLSQLKDCDLMEGKKIIYRSRRTSKTLSTT